MLAGPTTFFAPLRGLNAAGKPEWDFADARSIRLRGDNPNKMIISPYDQKTLEKGFPGNVRHVEMYPDGSLVAGVICRETAPNASGLANWGANAIAGFTPEGVIRWLQPIPHIKDPEGCKIVDDLSYTVGAQLSEAQIIDKDGLLIGAVGAPRELYWHGMWLDNTRQFNVMRGADGTHYFVFGNFNDCTGWFCEVQGRDTIRRSSFTVEIDAAKAAMLAALPLAEPWRAPENTITKVTVAKLPMPMPVNGDLEKWRKIIPVPQIIITPETGVGIDGPQDSSALIRLAHEGGNLYVQLLRFDNLVTMHQPSTYFYKADCFEMSINSFTTGVKINVTHSRDQGDIVVRDGWFLKAKLLDPAIAPRSITVLNDAGSISERKIIEDIYNVDLSQCKVIVTEFKIALDDEMFAERMKEKPQGTSGTSFYLGIAIDDNDQPGADLQRVLVWPATYGTFMDKTTSAQVMLE